jgi:hypothetical protein
VSVADWVVEGQSVARDFAFLIAYEEIDRTAKAVKFCLSIASGLFVSVYVNAASGKVSLALVHNSQRVFGRDNQGGTWHLHPVSNPSHHDFGPAATRPVSLREFMVEVESILLDLGLL